MVKQSKGNPAIAPNDAVKKMVKRLQKRKSNRRFSIALFLATGGMPWLV